LIIWFFASSITLRSINYSAFSSRFANIFGLTADCFSNKCLEFVEETTWALELTALAEGDYKEHLN
jgi:hypothetical protein